MSLLPYVPDDRVRAIQDFVEDGTNIYIDDEGTVTLPAEHFEADEGPFVYWDKGVYSHIYEGQVELIT